MARDMGSPPLYSEDPATITLRVQRNKNCPQLQTESFSASIDQNLGVDALVLAIEATDTDPPNTPFSKLTYELLGDDQAPTFFKIDETSGRVTVKADLKADMAVVYQLRVKVADGGEPACMKTAMVTINVNRNLKKPRFTREEWQTTILETHDITVPVLTVEARDEDDNVRNVTNVISSFNSLGNRLWEKWHINRIRFNFACFLATSIIQKIVSTSSVRRQKGLSVYLKQQPVRPFCLQTDDMIFRNQRNNSNMGMMWNSSGYCEIWLCSYNNCLSPSAPSQLHAVFYWGKFPVQRPLWTGTHHWSFVSEAFIGWGDTEPVHGMYQEVMVLTLKMLNFLEMEWVDLCQLL